MKTTKNCETCKKIFESYFSEKRKFCSHDCASRSYLKAPSDKISLSSKERQQRHRNLYPNKNKDNCLCGALKINSAKNCRKCCTKERTGSLSPYWKGGMEVHLRHNRLRIQQLKGLKRHTVKQWQALKEKYNYMCLRCKQQEPFIKLTRDHIIPLSKGGKDDISNIQPLCLSCNVKKYNNTINYFELLNPTKAGVGL